MGSVNALKEDLQKLADPAKAKVLQRFFKTRPGEYGEGDVFLGLTVPQGRKIAKKYKDLSLQEIKELLESEVHEERFCALIILILRYRVAEEEKDRVVKKEIYNFYLGNTLQVNSWDLVDLSAPLIVGTYLQDKKREVLYELAKSSSLWERRIAIISTLGLIRKGEFDDCLKIAEILIEDKQDLIHKAAGWMLREVGNRNAAALKNFLARRYKNMPRTMLRYAIERLPEDLRQRYLKGEV